MPEMRKAIEAVEPEALSSYRNENSDSSSLEGHEIKLSQAISLKRIADALEYLVFGLLDQGDDTDEGSAS